MKPQRTGYENGKRVGYEYGKHVGYENGYGIKGDYKKDECYMVITGFNIYMVIYIIKKIKKLFTLFLKIQNDTISRNIKKISNMFAIEAFKDKQ